MTPTYLAVHGRSAGPFSGIPAPRIRVDPAYRFTPDGRRIERLLDGALITPRAWASGSR